MGDVFIEQLIARETTTTTKLLKLLFPLLIIIAIISAFVLSVVFLIVAAVLIVLAVIYLPHLSCEYEYALTGKDFDIDVIYGKKRRKAVMHFDLWDVKRAIAEDGEKKDRYEGCIVRDFSSQRQDASTVLMLINYNGGTTAIRIEPEEELRKMLPIR